MTSPATNIPQPYWNTATGFVAPPESAILAGAIADLQQAFGGSLNLDPNVSSTLTTPQGQLASEIAATVGNADDVFCFFTTQVDPAYATGRMQDAIGRIYFMERNGAEPTVLNIVCSGGNGVVIPSGAAVIDSAGNNYTTSGGTIPGTGMITLEFSAVIPGPTMVPETVTIYQAISGWDSATVSGGTVGTATEGRAAFESRREASVEANALGIMGAILGSIANLPGVLDYWGIDNPTTGTVVLYGVSITANSMYLAVVGGTDKNVANAILARRPPGTPMVGNTTVNVVYNPLGTDGQPLYENPPTYAIIFERPTDVNILFSVVLVNSPAVPSNGVALVQNAIVSAFNGGFPGLTRARIASLLLSTNYVPVVQALGPWAQIRSLGINSANTPIVTATASFATNVMTVSAILTGGNALAIGQTIDDSLSNGEVAPGTIITGQTGGTTGGVGTYTLSQPVGTIASETVSALLQNQLSVQVFGNQEPVLNANNIAVTAT